MNYQNNIKIIGRILPSFLQKKRNINNPILKDNEIENICIDKKNKIIKKIENKKFCSRFLVFKR